MAAAQPHAPGQTAEDKPADPDKMKEQCNSGRSEMPIPSSALDTTSIALPRDSTSQFQPSGASGELPDYSTDIYAPQAQPLFYRGFDNSHSDWDEYSSYVNPERLEIGSPGVYNDNSSLLYHSGYGYSHQMPYGPYSPVTTPLPSVGGDAQMYSPQQFPYSALSYYQPLVSPTVPYLTSSMPVSQPDFTNLVSADQHCDSILFGSRPVYPPAGPFNGGSFPGGTGSFSFHDFQHGLNGLRSGGLWSDCSKPSDRARSAPFSPSVSPQPVGPVASFGQTIGVTSQQQKSLYGNSYGRGYLPNHGPSFAGSHISNLGTGGRSWISFENSRRRARGRSSLCSCNGTLDILSEQNRGPRASKTKIQVTVENSSVDINNHSTSVANMCDESFNRPDFVTEYKDAKFFVIKSYSEDNVHKSIKYGVWASTPNGNRKLDAACRQAKEKHICPIFLFFSVNASAQFCGVAEMIGPVDFDQSVDYWQQDKWTGQFPVRWHIIKDVPNSQFRHIVLENNDNKPVTNSRDTQEVKLEQGIEILKIFKNYETDTSILDDFDFYEERQKAMQERKARQQMGMIAVGVTGESEHKSAATLAGGFIKQVSKSFAQVVCLDEGSKEITVSERGSSVPNDSKVITNFDDDIEVPISSMKTT